MLIASIPIQRTPKEKNALAEQYLSLMASGDMAALGGLYELVKTDVYAFALSRTANREVAEDVTHDTFVRIWQYAPRYLRQGKPLAWIITVEQNLIRQHYLRENRFSQGEAEGEPSEDPTEVMVEQLFLEELLRTLSPEEREVISLHLITGLKHREIATLLGSPLSTVLSRYNRALKKLKTLAEKKEKPL